MPMLCIHILQSLIFEAVLLEALKGGQMHVEAAPARQALVVSVSGHWKVSWVVLYSVTLGMLVLKVCGRQAG